MPQHPEEPMTEEGSVQITTELNPGRLRNAESLDERALEAAARILHERQRELAEAHGARWIEAAFDSTTGYSRRRAMKEVEPIITTYLAALPEQGPPLAIATYRDMLHDAKHKLFEAAGAIDALGRPDYAREFAAKARSIQATLRDLEALAEHRKERDRG